MALSKDVKTEAVKGALGELIKMLGGMNMDRARKKKIGEPDALPDDPEAESEAEGEDEVPEDPTDDAEEMDGADTEDAIDEALQPRARKRKPKCSSTE